MTTFNIHIPHPGISIDYKNCVFSLNTKAQIPQDSNSVFCTLNKIKKILKRSYLYSPQTDDEFSKKPLVDTYLFLIKTANEIYKDYLFKNSELPFFSYLFNDQANVINVKNKINRLIAPKGHISQVYGCTHTGEKEIHLAVKAKNLSWLKLLLQRGDPIDAEDFDKRTPLYICFSTMEFSKSEADLRRTLEIAQFLINNGANINHQSHASHYHGYTSLHHAIKNKCQKAVKFLLNNKADPNIQEDLLHISPLHLAFEKKHEGILSLLIFYGADLTITNIYGLTPIETEFKQAEPYSLHFDSGNLIDSYYYNLLLLALQKSFIMGYHAEIPNSVNSNMFNSQFDSQTHFICCNEHAFDNHLFIDDSSSNSFSSPEIQSKIALRRDQLSDIIRQHASAVYKEGKEKGVEKKQFDSAIQIYSQTIKQPVSNILTLSADLFKYLGNINPKWKSYEECFSLNCYDVARHNPYIPNVLQKSD